MANQREAETKAQKELFQKVYEAALSGKPLSQGQVHKIYSQAIETQTPDTKKQTAQIPSANKALVDAGKTVDTTAAKNAKPTQAQISYANAQKNYDDYLASDEYKENRRKANKVSLTNVITKLFDVTGGITSDNIPQMPGAETDAKEKELQSQIDYYKRQMQAEEDQKVMDADLRELAGWSKEDLNNLERYIAERNTHAYNALNPMMDPQFDTYALNPVVQKYGIGKVNQLAESWQRNKNAEALSQTEQAAAKMANEKPWLGGVIGSVASVPSSLAGSYTSPIGYAVEMGQRTGRYSTLDPNNIGNIPSVYAETVRGEVAGNIRGDENNTNWLRQLAAIGYQGGMSAIDSAARTIASGGNANVAAAIASSGTFGSSLRQYSQQGVAPAQAAAMALTNAGIEYITEKIPTEKVLDMFKKGNTTGAVKNILTQAFLVEPTSEEVNLFAGVAAEAVILGEKSSKNQRLGELIANGMSYDEAQMQIYKELWKEAAQTYAVSAFSGGLSATGATVLGNIANGNRKQEVEKAEAPAAPVLDDKTQAQQIIKNTASELAQNAPAIEPAQPMTENQQNLENAIEETLGLEQKVTQQVEQKTVERISLEDYANNQSPVWNNVAYEDNATKAAITQDVHNKMVESGAVVNVSADILKATEQSYPDLRGMKKQERIPVLKEAVKALKNNLRQFLDTFKDQPFEFEVNGKILDAKLYNTGINEVLEKVTKEKASMLYSTEEIFKNARYLYSTPDYDGDPNVQRWNYFYTPVRIGEETVGVRIAVRDVANPQESQIYNWGIKKDAPLGGAGRGTNDRIPGGASSDASTNSIQGKEAEVKGTGAAEQNFSGKAQYQDLLYEGNVQPDRATDVRPMEVPKTDANKNPVSAVAANAYGSQYTTDDLASETESAIARGKLSYMEITNEKAAEKATKAIEAAGDWRQAYMQWHDSVRDGKTSAEMAARGALLLNHAAEVYEQVKANGTEAEAKAAKSEWLDILLDLRVMGTNTAQGLQAMRMIRELAPQDKMDFAVASVKRMVNKMGLDVDVQIDEALINEYRMAETDQQRDEVMGRIQQNVADQIPSTFLDKWTALRYTNMLGNLKTQVRNFAGNVGSMVAYRMKDQVAAGIEDVISLFNKNYTRQKAHVVSRKYLQFGKDDFNSFRGAVTNGGKFNERMAADGEFEQGVMDKRRVFKSDAKNEKVKKVGDFLLAPMEGYRRATNWLMNNKYFGDEAFGRTAYARALAGYLKANGVKDTELSNIAPELLDKARAYAVKEAQEATFKDNSALASMAGKLQNAAGVAGQGIMPFTKTPANVLTRAVEFSPIGVFDTAVKSAKRIAGNKEVTGADIVNSLAKTITGTGLVALGALAWDRGLLSGGPDEDDEKEQFDKMNGAQNYALQFQDRDGEMHSYTFDWLTPVVIPMFMGAELWKEISEKDDNATFADYVDLFTAIADPMIQMSMLQGLNDSLDGIKYSDNNLVQFFLNATISYLTQGLTNTLAGQIERSTEENRQTTFVDKDSNVPQWLQKQIGKASQKIPGWDYQQTDYRNAWGETEENEGGLMYNLLSPGYLSTEESSAVANELYRLRETTGENVFPKSPDKTLSYTDKDGQKQEKNLTAEEYEAMQKAEGQTAARVLNEVTTNADYAALSDAQKAKVVGLVYDYAREQGRVEAVSDYIGYSDSWMQNIGGNEAKTIVNKVVGADLKGAMDAMSNAWANDFDAAESVEALEAAYATYSNMSQATRKAVKDDTTGRVAAYMEARSNGVKTETFVDLYKTYWELDKSGKKQKDKAEQWVYTLEKAQESGKLTQKQKNVLKETLGFNQTMRVATEKFDELANSGLSAKDTKTVTNAINSLMPKDGKTQVSDAQKWDAIVKASLDEVSTDKAIKAYMTDYNPESSSPDKTELKYDYVRQEMGLDPKAYVKIYNAYIDVKNMDSKRLDTIGTTRKDEYFRQWTAAGMTYSQCTELYNLLVTTGKQKIDVAAWYENQQ